MSHSIAANKIEDVMAEMWQMMHNIKSIAVMHYSELTKVARTRKYGKAKQAAFCLFDWQKFE